MSVWDQSLQFLCSGLTVGSIYALIALGFTIIFNASGIVNFAQGEFVMLGALLAYSLTVTASVPLAASLALAVVIVTLVGLVLERAFIHPLAGRPVITPIIVTIGASIAIQGGAMLLWGKDALAVPALPGPPVVMIGPAVLQFQSVWVFGVGILTMIILRLFFQRTQTGRAMRANAANRQGALLVGVNPGRMVLLSFGLSAALGALAGVLVAPITLASYNMGTMLGLKGFAAAILGGLGSSPGAIVGGLLLGVLESLSAGFISSGYKDAVAFVLLLLMLFLRPTGLLGTRKTGGL